MTGFDILLWIALLMIGCVGISGSDIKILKGVSLATTILSTIMINKMVWSV